MGMALTVKWMFRSKIRTTSKTCARLEHAVIRMMSTHGAMIDTVIREWQKILLCKHPELIELWRQHRQVSHVVGTFHD